MHSVTSNAVYNASPTLIGKMEEGLSDVTDGTEFISSYASDNGFSETEFENQPFKRKFIKVWNYIKAKISSWMDSTPTSGSSNPITSGAVKDYADTLIKIYHKNIGTYTVGGGQTISPDINSFTKPAPNGYSRLSFLFAEDQNYFHCDVNFSKGVAYATITNKYTSSLSSRFTLYHIYIPWTGLIT